MVDDWKGIFSFPFEVEVFRNGCCHRYVLNVVNWRSTVELRFFKVVTDAQRFASRLYRPPIEDEFSAREMQCVDGYLYGRRIALRERRGYREVPDFVGKIEMQLVILGYRGGLFFQHRYDDPDEFWRDVWGDPRLREPAICEQEWPEALDPDWFVVRLRQ
ncbi:hypothetical protein [Accumulibacter sp.]|uniref:hypothetical protein n=1 Tax=Accumulibacter sp. TaxID=2053492 RepID=UPI0025FE96FE|nr:hypothetical protein [Accumulibacter sp.]MCM8624894.1 hypothetical protein [Accumulibacter sp.]